MKPGTALDAQIANAAEQLRQRQRDLRQDSVALKAHAARYASSPMALAVSFSVLGLVAWIRYRR
jgi:hypothetical protein